MSVNFINIPAELKKDCKFCVWKYEKDKSGRKTKVPYNPVTKGHASTDKPSTFADITVAMKTYALGGFDGVGIRVGIAPAADPETGKRYGIGAIDIDDCIREDGSLNDVAASILGILSTAAVEKSPSGKGLRVFFYVDADFAYDKAVYYINNRKLGLEVYFPGATNRFVTVTGNTFREGIVPKDPEAVQSILDTFMKRAKPVENKHIEARSYLSDASVIEHASNSANGERFKDYMDGNWQEYYDNQSDADMSFISMLCFWCGCDEEQIDRIYRSSKMMRDKWDRKQAGSTYGAITIRNAVTSCQNIYMPLNAADINDEFDDLDDEDGKKKKKADFDADRSFITLTIEDMKPTSNPRYGMGEIGVGNMFADYYEPIARYNSDRGVWYVYDGKVWQADIGALKVAELAKELADKLYAFALTIMEEDARKNYIERIRKLQLRKNRDTMIKDARSVYPLSMKAFDSDRYLFNCQNGTLDLRTMEFHNHDPQEFHTKVSQVVYDPDASCPRWVSFIDEVMSGDKERSVYLQKALGYALTADTRMECLFILYGATSRNGKGTTMETFLKIMGEYGKNADPGMLASKFNNQSTGGPSEEIARLAGSRFVNISEPDKKITLDAALTKRLTGNDTITARYLHENSFEFVPSFKIFINTNHLPRITDLTLFESGRIKIIPFNRHFEEHERDTGLKTFFAQPENLSGIFNWVVEGYRRFKTEKLDMPKSVIEATQEYQSESDIIGNFLSECVKREKGSEVRSQAMFERYKQWCGENGILKTGKAADLKKELEKHNIVYDRRKPWSANDPNPGSKTSFYNDVTLVVDDEFVSLDDESIIP